MLEVKVGIDSLWSFCMTSPATAQEQVFIGPGLSPFKRIATISGVIFLLALVLWIAIREGIFQGGSAVGSTIAAVLFIAGFVYYLRLIAPVPFTICLEKEALVKRSKKGEVIEIRWENLTRIKEEFFPNGKRIGKKLLLNARQILPADLDHLALFATFDQGLLFQANRKRNGSYQAQVVDEAGNKQNGSNGTAHSRAALKIPSRIAIQRTNASRKITPDIVAIRLKGLRPGPIKTCSCAVAGDVIQKLQRLSIPTLTSSILYHTRKSPSGAMV